MPPTTCSHCGAKLDGAAPSVCSYCGAPVAGAQAPPPEDDLAARFQRLRDHPRLPELLAVTPPIAGQLAGAGCGVLFLVVWTLGALGIGFGFFHGGQAVFGSGGGLAAVLPWGMAAVGIGLLATVGGQTARFAGAPWRRFPALVVDKKQRNKQKHLVLELEDGTREELQLAGEANAVVGELGVAYVKGNVLVAFEYVKV